MWRLCLWQRRGAKLTLDISPLKVILDDEKGACMVRKRRPGRPRDIINDDEISFRLPIAIKKHIERVATVKTIKRGTWIRLLCMDALKGYRRDGQPK